MLINIGAHQRSSAVRVGPKVRGASVIVAGASIIVASLGAVALPAQAATAARSDTNLSLHIKDTAGMSGENYIVTVARGVSASSSMLGQPVVANLDGPAFHGAVVRLSESAARELANKPGISSVERDAKVSVAGTGTGTGTGKDVPPGVDPDHLNRAIPVGPSAASMANSWGLDRTDQQRLPLDGDYSPAGHGAGVDAFVIDTGIALDSPDFAGRIGFGGYTVGTGVDDCNGHGTHVSGTIGSNVTGMADQVVIHPVRVLDCSGQGYTSDVIEAMNWVATNAPSQSVVNMSLGGSYSPSENSAAANMVSNGLVVAVAAGNSASDACDYSPASEPSLLTVGAIDSTDSDTSYSNAGPCLDLYAPGTDILSTGLSPGSYATMSGTSMASPHVAGAAAVYWSLNPEASSAAVSQAVLSQSTPGIINYPYGQAGSPNQLLNVQWSGGPPGTPGRPSTRSMSKSRVRVAWGASTANGNPVTYILQARLGAKGRWKRVAITAATSWAGKVRGARRGSVIFFRVIATSSAGASRPSPASRARMRAASGSPTS